MQRRRFLQLAAGAATGVVVPGAHALLLPSPRMSLSVRPMPLSSGARVHGTVISLIGCSSVAHELGAPIEMLWEKKSGGGDSCFQWVIGGASYDERPDVRLAPGRRYRLRMMNATAEPHPVHLQKHRFQVTRAHQAPVSLPYQGVIVLERYAVVDADLVLSS